MDIEGLLRSRDIRVQRRTLLAENWQERVIEALKKRHMGPHQVGAVSGSLKVRKSMEKDT